MKELLNSVYKRRSMRNYLDEKLTAEELTKVKDYLQQLKPLCEDIKVDYKIVPCKDTNCKFNAEYCLIVYSEEKNLWLANIGYMLEQWDLYLTSLNIGVCWYGMGKVEEKMRNGLNYGIMLCFGKNNESDFRTDITYIKRKDVGDVWSGITDGKLGEIVRLAPSAVNSQPWKVEQNGNELKVYRVKGNTPVLSGILFKHWNKVDIGIFMCFLEVALESEGYAFTKQLHADTDDKKKILTATYTISAM